MLTQRETDIAMVEVQLEIQKLLEEWVVDYLGNRYGDNTGNSAINAGGQEAGDAQAAAIGPAQNTAY